MKKRPKRFVTEGQIIKAIDSAQARIRKYTMEMEAAQTEVRRLAAVSLTSNVDFDLKSYIKKNKNLVALAQGRVKRIAKDLPRLSQKLSVFRTPTLRLGNQALERSDIPV